MPVSAEVQAKWENEIRKRLAAIRDEAMELAAAIEFTGTTEPQDHPLHRFAISTINGAEYYMTNQRGELEFPE